MTTSQPRQPKGQPVGGQFASKHQSSDELTGLNTATSRWVPHTVPVWMVRVGDLLRDENSDEFREVLGASQEVEVPFTVGITVATEDGTEVLSYTSTHTLCGIRREHHPLTEETLSAVMDFDHPIRVGPGGFLEDVDEGIYAPTVCEIDGVDDPRWELLTGYTSQYGYNGSTLHASESIGGGLARDIINEPGVYVAVVVQPEDSDEEPEGWAVARLKDS